MRSTSLLVALLAAAEFVLAVPFIPDGWAEWNSYTRHHGPWKWSTASPSAMSKVRKITMTQVFTVSPVPASSFVATPSNTPTFPFSWTAKPTAVSSPTSIQSTPTSGWSLPPYTFRTFTMSAPLISTSPYPVSTSATTHAINFNSTISTSTTSSVESSQSALMWTSTSQSRSTSTRSSTSSSSSTSSTSTSTSSSTSTSTSASPSSTYGSIVDVADTAPPNPSAPPTILPQRQDGNLTVVGSYSAPFVGAIGGAYDMFYSGQYLNISGTGYFSLNWEIGFGNQVPGQLVMPVWSSLKGKLFHVASGGGHRMSDHRPQFDSWCSTTGSWMGCPGGSFDTIPAGALQMWQLEWYWLDGSVMLMDTENAVDYDLGVSCGTWAGVTKDINTPLNLGNEILRYGIVRDTGDDMGPVPQYTTNAMISPLDIDGHRAVGQVSDVTDIPV